MHYALLLLPLLAACAATPPRSGAAQAASVDAATLGAYHWQLRNATGRDGQRIDALFARPQRPLQLDFADGRLGVANACNRIGGAYRIEAGRLVVGRLAQTLMACTDPALANLDAAIGQRLEARPRIELRTDAEPHLRLSTDDGDTLDFAGAATAETRYGVPGRTVFLEVDAQTQPCTQPHGQRCLRVRERHYDANGLAGGTPGEWHLLPQDIEGYAHEEGMRDVLRVKRYDIEHAPAGTPTQAYVLDMVVESGRAGD